MSDKLPANESSVPAPGASEGASGRGMTSAAPRLRPDAAPSVIPAKPLRVANRHPRIEQRLSVVPIRGGIPLPSTKPRPAYGVLISFALCVLLPVLAASIYFAFFASNQYAAEFRFSVQDSGSSGGLAPSAGGSLLGLLGGFAGKPGGDNNYVVVDYLTSRQVIEDLQAKIDLKGLYTKPEIDWWFRFNPAQPVEKFVSYWQNMISAHYDMVTGIASAEVRAFSPEDALLVANTLVTLSEDLVNRISNRALNDAVAQARREVEQAQTKLKEKRVELTTYRNKFGIIDPTTSVAASNSALIQSQRAALAQLETQLSMLQSQHLQPNAPAIISLKSQIESNRKQLATTEAQVGQAKDGSALSTVVGEYEQLAQDVTFAQALVTSAMQALEQARATAAAQRLYISPYVRPSLPASSTYPSKFVSVLVVGIFAFMFWVIGLMTVRAIHERFA